MKRFLCAVAPLLVAVVCLAQTADNPVALKDEPHHRLLVENEYVRAWAFGINGHDATLLHNHPLPYLGLTVGAADYVNAVAGKPEAHATLKDGQIGWSKGGFAHLVRTETDTPFRNITVELLKAQANPRNRCVKVIADGALDCPAGAETPVAAATTLVMETDEVAVQEGSVSSVFQISGPDAKQAHLVGALENAQIRVDIPKQPPKTLNPGEAIWLDAGTAAALSNTAAGESRFVLLSFKDSTAVK
jgi:hypothetical protein